MDELWHEFTTFHCGTCSNKLVVPVYCGNRFCSVCGSRRRARVRRRLAFMVSRGHIPRGYSLKFLTLTIPNVEDLDAGILTLQNSFRKLRHRIWWKRHVHGGAFVIEVTQSEAGYHVHMHALIVSRFLPCLKLSQMWAKVSPGKIVYISKVATEGAVRYLTKYLTKEDASPDFEATLNRAFRNVRMFQPFGSWHTLRDPTPKPRCVCNACGGDKWYVIERPHYWQVANVTQGQAVTKDAVLSG